MSKALTLKQLFMKLTKGEISPLYFIMGPEIFLVQESLKIIQSHVLSTSAYDFNYEVFRVGVVRAETIRTAVETLPVLSKKRMVVCEFAQSFTESDWRIIEPLLKTPIKTCVVVFISSSEDKRKKIIKKLLSSCALISAQTPKESEWSVWIQWMGQKHGLSFSPQAIELLKQQSGHHLMNLKNEIGKIKNFLGDKKQISAEDVLSIVPRTRPENIFALSKAIGQQNLSSALICLKNLLEDNQNELGALALITRHIRILIRVKEGVNKKWNVKTIIQKTGLPFFIVNDYIKESHLWTQKKLLFVLSELLNTDQALKVFPISSAILLENFIIKTCSINKKRGFLFDNLQKNTEYLLK